MIAVNEIYGPTYQGEGRSAKMRCMFLRTSGCNLACDFCDTPFTWNWKKTRFVHPDKYDPKDEVHKMKWVDVCEEILSKCEDVKSLVISGGEPLLQQDRLIPLLKQLKSNEWWIEVETNGTIAPTDDFASLVDQFNCSPKTGNSGPDNPYKDRIIPSALEKIVSCGDKATFKFVIQSDEDVVEVMSLIMQVRIQPKSVYLMPEGRTTQEQLDRQERVKLMAQTLGYNFTPRLHILEFGTKRGV